MDMLTTVNTPNINYLASPHLTRLGSSFFSSQQNQPLIPEFDATLTKPFIPTSLDKDKSTRSSSPHLENQSLHKNSSYQSHQCSYAQAVLNGLLKYNTSLPVSYVASISLQCM